MKSLNLSIFDLERVTLAAGTAEDGGAIEG